MEEPTVLDYVKARLKFWEKTTLTIPALMEESAAPVAAEASQQPVSEAVPQWIEGTSPAENENATASPVSSVLSSTVDTIPFAGRNDAVLEGPAEGILLPAGADGGAPAAATNTAAYTIPWLALLPVGLALVAQNFLEPPNPAKTPAVILYILAAITTGIAFWRGDLRPAAHADPEPQIDEMDFHWGEAAIGAPVAVIAFMLFTNNRFTALNVVLWALSLGLFLVAFLQGERLLNVKAGLRRAFGGLHGPQDGWNIRISRWGLLLLAVTGLVVFFRFYHLDTLPIEMVSDHAEKLLDINDVLNGQYSIFFVRNTGREPFQFYWTALVIKLFGLGVSFFSLKLATVLTGLIAVYFTYKLGGLMGNRWVALLALILVGVSYWPNVISRVALRFPLYPMFVAPLLYYLIRGLRNSSRNDFIWAGLWLGIGLNGYTASRVVPLLVLVAFGLYFLHQRNKGNRLQAWAGLLLVVFFSFLLLLPLLHYSLENPQMVLYRSQTRMGTLEKPLDAPALQIFLSNLWAAVTMFFYDNGSIWVHSIPFRPAFDVVTAAFFFVGLVLILARYIKEHDWEDLLLLISVPILLLPSVLSLAFPAENPSLNRTASAYVPALVIAALGMEGLLRGIARQMPGRMPGTMPGTMSSAPGRFMATLIAIGLLLWTISANYNLFFKEYDQSYKASAWNTREVGEVVRDFATMARTYDTYYVVGFPYWLDSRQIAIFAGHIERDPGILPEHLADTLSEPRMKLFILKPEDSASMDQLRQLYPLGRATLMHSEQPGKDFVLFLVPTQQENFP
jgi:hypothetical protein